MMYVPENGRIFAQNQHHTSALLAIRLHHHHVQPAGADCMHQFGMASDRMYHQNHTWLVSKFQIQSVLGDRLYKVSNIEKELFLLVSYIDSSCKPSIFMLDANNLPMPSLFLRHSRWNIQFDVSETKTKTFQTRIGLFKIRVAARKHCGLIGFDFIQKWMCVCVFQNDGP